MIFCCWNFRVLGYRPEGSEFERFKSNVLMQFWVYFSNQFFKSIFRTQSPIPFFELISIIETSSIEFLDVQCSLRFYFWMFGCRISTMEIIWFALIELIEFEESNKRRSHFPSQTKAEQIDLQTKNNKTYKHIRWLYSVYRFAIFDFWTTLAYWPSNRPLWPLISGRNLVAWNQLLKQPDLTNRTLRGRNF